MKTITLTRAHELLTSASAVVIDNVVTYPSLAELEDNPANQFLCLTWDDEGLEFAVRFNEEGNAVVNVEGASLWLVDDEGDQAQITLLAPMAAEAIA
jgi:hypothetical protein